MGKVIRFFLRFNLVLSKETKSQTHLKEGHKYIPQHYLIDCVNIFCTFVIFMLSIENPAHLNSNQQEPVFYVLQSRQYPYNGNLYIKN
uniref:Uncharacterized protein n=1 Tax=Pyxicephalus adspersus TaxID=30357 RepID=A0AAV3ATM4_PYXAD|nr:TPA: hypothetical protein GDO54_008286 [Pyxicephalus adspersus]